MDKFMLLVVLNILFYGYTSGYLTIENEESLPNHAFDQQLYKDVLDPELCQRQLNFLRFNNTVLLARFLDNGFRTPRGIFNGNFMDVGSYHKCLEIREEMADSAIEGKYCRILVPFDQELNLPDLSDLPEIDWPNIPWPNITWPDLPWPELNPNTTRISQDTFDKMRIYNRFQHASDVSRSSRSFSFRLNLALCIPKACTTRETIDGLLFNTTELNFQYEDTQCRLPNDKPWVAADYVAIVLFSIIALITILSTSYDVRHNVILKSDPKRINKIYQAFSVYTNMRRLVTYTPVPGNIECLDGVRTFAILWVIVGHTFLTHVEGTNQNPLDAVNWFTSLSSLWINVAPITVDTFFLLSGMLVVYTTVGKLTRLRLFQNLHLFYLNRLLRMFPILASFVLIQASILHRVSDGPLWNRMVLDTNSCRVYWWSTLLYVQNYVNPDRICLPHTWYLAIDIQLHIISPLILFWLLGTRKRVAWIVLSTTMVVTLTAATLYNALMKFPSTPLNPEEYSRYTNLYYFNTLSRCPPFFIGMIYGYLLHLYRDKVVVIPKTTVALLWICAFTLSTTVFGGTYPIYDLQWNNPSIDALYNSLARPAWALAIGWLIFACHHGYGGPVNWFLSLRAWKVPSRISYAMYITHLPLMILFNSTSVIPFYFTAQGVMFHFYRDVTMTMLVSLILTVVIDSPFSTLIKVALGGGAKRPPKAAIVVEDKTEQINGHRNAAFSEDETKSEKL